MTVMTESELGRLVGVVVCCAVQMNPIVRAVEPAACPSLTKGTYTYDYGDSAGVCAAQCVREWLPLCWCRAVRTQPGGQSVETTKPIHMPSDAGR